MNILINYYGKNEVHRVLSMSPSEFVPAVSLLPLLTSITSDCESSSVSSYSEENAVTPTTSPGGSPLHSFSDESVVMGRSNPSSSRSKKRQRNGLMPIISGLAVCALLGCSILPPTAFQKLFGQTNVPQTPEVQVHSRRLLEEDISPIYSIDKWSNIDLPHLVKGKVKKQHQVRSWVISPIESHPNLWSFHEGTPWSVERSTQLFDFRSSSQMSGKDVAAVPFALSRPLRREIVSVNNFSKSKTVQSLIHSEIPNRYLRGAIPTPMIQDNVVTDNSEEDLQALPEQMDKALVHIEKRGSIGSSFLFCPSAYASLSPGFMELAGLSPENKSEGLDGQASVESLRLDWDSNSAYVATSMSNQKDFSEYIDGTGSVVDTIDSLLDESHFLLHDKSIRSLKAQDEDSKALVPTVYNKKLGVNDFSFSNIGGEPVGNSVSVVQGDDPFMSILFPASAISGDFSSSEQKNQPWIEIGCQVLSARIVDGVSFVGDRLREEN